MVVHLPLIGRTKIFRLLLRPGTLDKVVESMTELVKEVDRGLKAEAAEREVLAQTVSEMEQT